jgi:hypothetical protein
MKTNILILSLLLTQAACKMADTSVKKSMPEYAQQKRLEEWEALDKENQQLKHSNEVLSQQKQFREESYSELKNEYDKLYASYADLRQEEVAARRQTDDAEQLRTARRTNYQLSQANEKLTLQAIRLAQRQRQDSTSLKYLQSKGYVVFHSPASMRENEAANVVATIGSEIHDNTLRTRIIEVVNRNLREGEAAYTLDELQSGSLQLSNRMKIEAYPDTIDFAEISLLNGDAIKEIDLRNGTQWKWRVRPKRGTAGKSVKLTFNIYSLNEENEQPEWIKEEEFNFKVEVEKSLYQTYKEVAYKYPKWTISSILIPFISFFAGMWKEKQGQKNRRDQA